MNSPNEVSHEAPGTHSHRSHDAEELDHSPDTSISSLNRSFQPLDVCIMN